MKQRKTILIVDNNSELEQLIREPLLSHLKDSEISPVLVRAKDGAEAAIKSENQKFDMVLIDTEVPRLMDGGFIYGLQSYRNTQEAELMVVSPQEAQELPESLQVAHFFKKPVIATELIAAMIEALNVHPPDKKGTGTAANIKFAVDVRVINAIIKATTHVLGQFGVTDVQMGKATPKAATDPLLGEISSIVDIRSGNFTGYLCISFEKASYLKVVSTMLMEEQSELTPDNQDAVGEINNIIFGNSKADLSQFGVQMTVPKVLIGAGKTLPCETGSAGMLIPFSTGAGKFYITVVAFPCS